MASFSRSLWVGLAWITFFIPNLLLKAIGLRTKGESLVSMAFTNVASKERRQAWREKCFAVFLFLALNAGIAYGLYLLPVQSCTSNTSATLEKLRQSGSTFYQNGTLNNH